jgi:hypothetical protein
MKNEMLLELEHIRGHVNTAALQSPIRENDGLLETRVLDDNVVALGVDPLDRNRALARAVYRLFLYESFLGLNSRNLIDSKIIEKRLRSSQAYELCRLPDSGD